jgi:hypothetical protein
MGNPLSQRQGERARGEYRGRKSRRNRGRQTDLDGVPIDAQDAVAGVHGPGHVGRPAGPHGRHRPAAVAGRLQFQADAAQWGLRLIVAVAVAAVAGCRVRCGGAAGFAQGKLRLVQPAQCRPLVLRSGAARGESMDYQTESILTCLEILDLRIAPGFKFVNAWPLFKFVKALPFRQTNKICVMISG